MSLFSSKEKTVCIYVTDCERRIIIYALKKLRDEQIRENKNYDFIETIIAKSAKANIMKGIRNSHETR
ncbi:hypothetical protein [Massilimicrobiota sp. An134]|uniref:hypothetical protein n=1 Tax=Massilimicrobiota sp. An134 TaxID=1965557 RepID=UPI000B377BFD|nr:hypothetical protein [Massilimicrobiota sp. An134]OUQ29761.1 hypothetical protein B5E79_05910 [Massilimicrobiota sp. An134]